MKALSSLASLLVFAACSAGGDPPSKGPGSNSPNDPSNPETPVENPDDVFMGDLPGSDRPGADRPANIGTEALCDGVDENQNGIVDDVDTGKDGLCDCLHIGFLGGISGESGQTTGSFAGWLEERSDVPIRQLDAQAALGADVLSGLQVLIIGNLVQRTYSGSAPYFSQAEVSALSDWVQNGGGLMALAGYTGDSRAAAPSNELLAPGGITYDLTTFPGSGTWTQANTDKGVSYVVQGFSPHPTTEGVTALGVFHGYPVVGDGSVIAADSGYDVGMAKEVGAGHVVVWADEWITNDSEWTARDDLQVARFWLNTFRWLTPANECQVPIPEDIF